MNWLSNATGVDININPFGSGGGAGGLAGSGQFAINTLVNQMSEQEKQAQAAREEEARKKKEEEDKARWLNPTGKQVAQNIAGEGGQIGMAQGTGTSDSNLGNWYVKSQNEFGMYAGGEGSTATNPWGNAAGGGGATPQGPAAPGGDQGGYPTMANDYGLGQTSPTPGSSSNPGFAQQDISVTVPDSGSRGFNPWSLSGEALSRR